MEPLTFRRFDLDCLKTDRIIMLVGKRGSGKSTLAEEILVHLRGKTDLAMGMTPTGDSLKMFSKYIPQTCLYKDFDPDALERVLSHQEQVDCAAGDMGPLYTVLVVMDDCMYDPKVLKGPVIRKLHMNGRHLKICFMNLVQYVMDYPKALRGSVDYVFAFWEPSKDNRECLYKTFFGIFPSLAAFEQALRVITRERGVMVADFTGNKTDLQEVIFFYRAKEGQPRVCLGNRDFWKMHYAEMESELRQREMRRLRERQQAEQAKEAKPGAASAPAEQITLSGPQFDAEGHPTAVVVLPPAGGRGRGRQAPVREIELVIEPEKK